MCYKNDGITKGKVKMELIYDYWFVLRQFKKCYTLDLLPFCLENMTLVWPN